MKRLGYHVIPVAVLTLGLAVPASSAIITTVVNAGMRIDIGGVTDAIATDSDAVLASVSIFSPFSGATAFATLHLDHLTPEEANLDFSIGYDSAGFAGSGYMGQSSGESNKAVISYHANVNSTLEYGWNFDYLGPNPFGLQTIRLLQDGSALESLGNFGIPGHHEGTGSFGLLGGLDYTIEVVFSPNVIGTIANINGELAGDIFFDFNGQAVPEPAAISLLGLGLMALATWRRRDSL